MGVHIIQRMPRQFALELDVNGLPIWPAHLGAMPREELPPCDDDPAVGLSETRLAIYALSYPAFCNRFCGPFDQAPRFIDYVRISEAARRQGEADLNSFVTEPESFDV